MSHPSPLFLDDLAVGMQYHSREHALDVQQITDYARQFDPQPFHLDAAAAEHTLFQGLAASGWHTAAITMRLMVDSVPMGNGLIGAGAQIDWPRPTRPGDTLRVTSTILDITPSRSKPDRGIVTVEILTLNQRQEVCQRMVTKIVAMRRQDA